MDLVLNNFENKHDTNKTIELLRTEVKDLNNIIDRLKLYIVDNTD
jgi:hypothetical protein